MTEAEYKKLLNWKSKDISIGISENGGFRCAIGIPWNKTSNAYKMQTPNVWITKDDLSDSDIMNEISKHEVTGCYISTPLDDYSFLEGFPMLQDLSIKNGYTIKDLSFIRKLKECIMFFLHGARLRNLDDIVETKKEARIRYMLCLGLHSCEIDDISSALNNEKQYYSEFLIWMPQGSNEKERWKNFKQGSRGFHIYEYVPKKPK